MTPIYDLLVAELGDPAVFAAHDREPWEPWVYDLDAVHDLAQAPMTRGPRKKRRRK